MMRPSQSMIRAVAALVLTAALAAAQTTSEKPAASSQTTAEKEGTPPKRRLLPPAWGDPNWKTKVVQKSDEKIEPYVPPKDAGDRGQYNGYGRDTKGAIRLIRAAELRQEQTTGQGEIVYLQHDVKIVQDSLTIWCDDARHYRTQKRLEMFGKVVMINPKQRLDADRVTYYETSRRTLARGHVVVTRDSMILRSNTAEYNVEQGVIRFEEPFTIRDVSRDVVMTGTQGSYNTRLEKGIVPLDPVLKHYDSTGCQDAEILADYMEFSRLSGVVVARDSVQITWKDVKGRCQELWFWPDSSRALMIDEPSIWRGRDEADGDSIWLFVTGSLLDSTVITGNAVAWTPSDSSALSPRSTLRGRRIVMDFDNGKVSRMQSDREAIGIYHLFDKGRDRGSNKVSGDRVVLLMRAGELRDVIVIGGTQGVFLPPRLAKKTLRKDDSDTTKPADMP
ncbi:MAG: LptA/OstA family protein [bacterium]